MRGTSGTLDRYGFRSCDRGVRERAGDRSQAQAQASLAIDSYRDTWNAGLLLFGLHLLLLGWLAWRSGYVPKVLAVLLGVAGVGYAFDSVAAVLVGHGAPTIAEVTFLGEVLLAVWLIVWSRRLPRDQAALPGARA